MPKPELKLINQPISTNGHLFDEILHDSDGEEHSSIKDPGDAFEKKPSDGIKVERQIAGRAPVSNGAFGLVNGVDTNLGAGMRLAVFRGLKEVGLGFVESLYDNAGGDFELPAGAALALKYKEKSYEPGSRYLKEDEVRKACDEAFRRDGRDIIWVETEGLAEIGGGTGGTLPIGAIADANATFKLSSLIRYRRLEPYESASGSLLKGQAFANTVDVPITATHARHMPPGGEFEFTGEGHFTFVPELAKPIGLKGGGGSIGASARLGAECEVKGEITISVQRLPFGDEVLVKIGHAKSANASVGVGLKAGLEMKDEAYEKIPELGRGFLKYALERLGLPDVPKFVKRFLQSQIQIKSRVEKRTSEIARYVFDLSKPKARKAYEDIFTRLSLGNTRALIAANDDSVRSQKAGESASISEKGGAALLGQTKLLLLCALQAEREGKVSIDGRKDVLYRDCKFEKTYVNWFHGEQKVKWEAVTVTNDDKKSKQNYFHLGYSNIDRITEESEIEQFIHFAEALGIKTMAPVDEDGIDPASAARVLADRDDIETRADIYFTHEGIARITKASKKESIAAYLAAQDELQPNEHAPNSKLLERFQQISQMWFFVRWFYFGEISRLRKEYAQLAPGRTIDGDAKTLKEAVRFAEAIEKIAENDERSAETFFMALGRASGFDFMKKIAALTKLASINETILHELSISGGGLTLGAVDEGEILHPEKAMHRILTRIA